MNVVLSSMFAGWLEVAFEKPGNVWVLCCGKLYDIGEYRRCKLVDPVVQRAKTAGGVDIILPRLFDLCRIEVAASPAQALAVIGALAHDRDISIGFEIKYPDDTSVGVVLFNVFAGNFEFDYEFDADKNPFALLRLDLFSKAVTSVSCNGEPTLTKENENFRLTHPLLKLHGKATVEQEKLKEQQNNEERRPVQRTTDMLSLTGYNPHKG